MSVSAWNRPDARAKSRHATRKDAATRRSESSGKRPSEDHRTTADSEPEGGEGWIGVDFAHFATGQPSRALLPLLILGLLVALGVASLRIDLIRTRYALADAMKQEKRLIQEQHALIIEKLQGRDPVELAVLAEARGFKPITPSRRLVDPLPVAGLRRFELEPLALPDVAAGPPPAAAGAATEPQNAAAATAQSIGLEDTLR